MCATSLGDSHLAIGRSFNGVQIVDTSAAPSLSVVGQLGGFPITTAAIEGDVLYAFYYGPLGGQLRAIDVSDPTAPALLGMIDWEPGTLWSDAGTLTAMGADLALDPFQDAADRAVELIELNERPIRIEPVEPDAQRDISA